MLTCANARRHVCGVKQLLSNIVQVTNGKGGVGKTALTANLAGLMARSGWQVLAVDLDPQEGNLARELGVLDRADGGANLREAVRGKEELEPMVGVRDRLDLVAGGPELLAMGSDLAAFAARGEDPYGRLERALRSVADRYHVILVDSPPGEASLQVLAGRAAHYLLVPTTVDDAGIDGLATVFERYASLRAGANPDLEVLGVVITLAQRSAKALLGEARAEIDAVVAGGGVKVFDSVIPFVQGPAVRARRAGLLAHEYEETAVVAAKTRFERLRKKKPGGETVASAESSSGLAGDYAALGVEVAEAYKSAQANYAASGGDGR